MNERNRQTRRDQSARHNDQPKYKKARVAPYRRDPAEVRDYIERLNEGYDNDLTA